MLMGAPFYHSIIRVTACCGFVGPSVATAEEYSVVGTKIISICMNTKTLHIHN